MVKKQDAFGCGPFMAPLWPAWRPSPCVSGDHAQAIGFMGSSAADVDRLAPLLQEPLWCCWLCGFDFSLVIDGTPNQHEPT